MKLADAKTLAYFNPEAETIIITDASPYGVGAILAQKQNDTYRVVCYASRGLSSVERRYSQTEREALAIVWACERFHMYLYGITFTIISDHKPLEFIYAKRTAKVCARVERWVLRLQNYQYKVKYQPGPLNAADSLSRLSLGESTTDNTTDEYVYFVAQHAAPKVYSPKEIERASESDRELEIVRQCIKTGRWDTAVDEIRRHYQPIQLELSCLGKLILRGTRIVMPLSMRQDTIKLAHEGHQGIVRTKQRLREKVFWPNMDKEVEKLCKSCHECQLVSGPATLEPLQSTKMPDGPWKFVSIDLMGPFPSGHNILVVVDYYSRYFEIAIMKSVTSEQIICALDDIFAVHGFPIELKSDNGPQFVSELFTRYLEENGIKLRHTTPYWPKANGEVERQNKTLLKAIRTANASGKNWRHELNKFLLAYRSTPHSATGVSPAELLFGRKLRTKLPQLETSLLDEEIQDRDKVAKYKQAQYYDQRHNVNESTIQVGDSVLVSQPRENKLSTRYDPEPLKVVDKRGTQVIIQSSDGGTYARNTSHVKRYHSETSVQNTTDSSSLL
jgi:hypothetical protein